MRLIQSGAAANVASLFYLVPPATAVEAWWLFDEKLGWLAIVGMLVAVLGVAMVVQRPQSQSKASEGWAGIFSSEVSKAELGMPLPHGRSTG